MSSSSASSTPGRALRPSNPFPRRRPNPRKKENHMTIGITPPADSKASRLMRQAILQELQCPPRDPEAPAADNLQQVARSLVNTLAQGDVSAIKAVLERIDGKAAGRPSKR